MRKALAPMLALAFLALGLAGFAWSGPSQVQAEPQSPPAAPGGEPEASLLELYPEPVEAGDCGCVDCINERTACWETCNSAPDYWACRAECSSVYQACMSHC
jgi:hypothetical protein